MIGSMVCVFRLDYLVGRTVRYPGGGTNLSWRVLRLSLRLRPAGREIKDFLAFLVSPFADAFSSPDGVVPNSEFGSRGLQSPSNRMEITTFVHREFWPTGTNFVTFFRRRGTVQAGTEWVTIFVWPHFSTMFIYCLLCSVGS